MKRSIRRWLKNLVLRRWTEAPDPYHHPQIEVGRHTYGLSPFTVRLNRTDDRIVVGKFCSIGPRVTILGSGEHYHDRVSTYPFTSQLLRMGDDRDTKSRGGVIIGHDVWIGACAVILSGARIGSGAVVAAGAVVTGGVPAYGVVAGVPAKLQRYRFDEEQRRRLLDIAWWDWPDSLILQRLEDFYNDPCKFIDLYWEPRSRREQPEETGMGNAL